jgi:peptidoglycan-associated lipoprotein
MTAGAMAQDASKVDLFAGFSLLNSDSPTGASRKNSYGGQASATAYFNKWLGLTADFGGQRQTFNLLSSDGVLFRTTPIDLSAYEFAAGPQVRLQKGRLSPFAHVLAGGVHQTAATGIDGSGGNVNVTASETSLMVGVGGGLDVNVTKHIGVRLVQFDWLPARVSGEWATDTVRLGFGIVFKIGG